MWRPIVNHAKCQYVRLKGKQDEAAKVQLIPIPFSIIARDKTGPLPKFAKGNQYIFCSM